MKLLALFIAPILLFQQHNIQFSPRAGGAEDFSDINCFIIFETECGGTECDGPYILGTGDCCVSDSTLADSSQAQTDSTRTAAIGTYSSTFPSSNDRYNINTTVQDETFNSTAGRVGFWFQADTATPGSHNIVVARDSTTSTDDFKIKNLGDGELAIEWTYNTSVEATCTSTTAGILADTWYFLQFRYSTAGGAGADSLEIFVDASSVQSCTGLTLTPIDGVLEELWFGKGGGDSIDTWIDNFMISDDETRDLYAIRNETSEANLSNSCGS